MIKALDFLGREIKAGDALAVAITRGRGAVLEQRFVREVLPDGTIVVQSHGGWVTDKRTLGRLLDGSKCIITP